MRLRRSVKTFQGAAVARAGAPLQKVLSEGSGTAAGGKGKAFGRKAIKKNVLLF